MSNEAKRFVYILRSVFHPVRHYVGLTHDVRKRLGLAQRWAIEPYVEVQALDARCRLGVLEPTNGDCFREISQVRIRSRPFAKRHFAKQKRERITRILRDNIRIRRGEP